MEKCVNCQLQHQCSDSAASWIFLFIGLIATIAVRLVNLMIGINPFWAKAFWYIGIVGFAVYFLYKFRQDIRIKAQLRALDLDQKLAGKGGLSEQEYAFLGALLCSLRSKKDAVNYFFIFFTSAFALAIGIFQDFIFRRLP